MLDLEPYVADAGGSSHNAHWNRGRCFNFAVLLLRMLCGYFARAITRQQDNKNDQHMCAKAVGEKANKNKRKASAEVLLGCVQPGMAITIIEQFFVEILQKGHGLRKIIEGERTRVWCRTCARYAWQKCGNCEETVAEENPNNKQKGENDLQGGEA